MGRRSKTRGFTIRFLTGNGVEYGHLPSHCHSGRPDHVAISQTPHADGWTYVVHPPEESRRDGWWCPDCVRDLRELLSQMRGITKTSGTTTVLPPTGEA